MLAALGVVDEDGSFTVTPHPANLHLAHEMLEPRLLALDYALLTFLNCHCP